VTNPIDMQLIKERAEELVNDAARWGVVLTISLKPLEPLAMGNHEMVVDVQPRKPYE